MKKVINIAILFIMVVSDTIFSAALPVYWDQDYDQRQQDFSMIASKYPGRFFLFRPKSSLDGMLVQTSWQQKTGRDQSLLWALVNSSLTVEPVLWAEEFSSQGSTCSEMAFFDGVEAENIEAKQQVCQRWLKYFRASNRRSLFSQSYLWKAHTASVEYILQVYAEDFENYRDQETPEEFAFWEGWSRFVFFLEKINFPTTKFLTAKISEQLLPSCYPLGSENCKLEDLSPEQSLFVSYLSYGTVEHYPYLLRFINRLL